MTGTRATILATAAVTIGGTGGAALLQSHYAIGWAMVAFGVVIWIGSWMMVKPRKGRDGGPYFDPEKLEMLDGPVDPNGPLVEAHLSEDIRVRGRFRGPPRQWLKATASKRIQMDIDDEGEEKS